METSFDYGIDIKLPHMIDKFKLSNIENIIMKMLQKIPESSAVYYIGEYNKTDSMF